SLKENSAKLNSLMEERTRYLNETLAQRAFDITQAVDAGQIKIDSSLGNVLGKLTETLEEKGLSFRQSLQNSADEAVMDLDLRSGFFDEKLQATVGQITSSFDERVAEF